MGCEGVGLVLDAFGCDVLWELLCGFFGERVIFLVFGRSRVVFGSWFQRGAFVGHWWLVVIVGVTNCGLYCFVSLRRW